MENTIITLYQYELPNGDIIISRKDSLQIEIYQKTQFFEPDGKVLVSIHNNRIEDIEIEFRDYIGRTDIEVDFEFDTIPTTTEAICEIIEFIIKRIKIISGLARHKS